MDEPEDSDDDFLRAVARTPKVQPRSEPAPETLTRLAQFRIEGQLGRGGMGIVYRAEDEKLRRVVALKVLPDDFAGDEQKRKRFFREARVAGAINHPNVATIYDVGEAEGRIYIAMELVPGVTLRKLLEDRDRHIDQRDALHIAQEIARGVSRAHARGIAHRDLKPDNVMVDDDGKVKVLDFGLAKPVEISAEREESVTWTQEGRIVGTPGYMSPEQATGRPVDVRTDVFSLGVILYEMLGGRRPFVGDTSMEIVIATSRDRPLPLSSLVPEISRDLDVLVARCLAKDPLERFASADDLLVALETVAAQTGQAASATHAEPATRSRAWLVAAAAAIIGVATWRITAPAAAPLATPTPASLPAPAFPSTSTNAAAETSASAAPIAIPSLSQAPPPAASPAASPFPSTSAAPPRVSSPSAAAARIAPRPAIPASAPVTSATAAPAATPSAARRGVIETSPY